MSPGIVALVLCSAGLHATWNALLKGETDRLRAMAVMGLTASGVAVPLVFGLPLPANASWPYVLTSAALHTGYNLCLIGAYRHGDLGQVYPVARGSSPLLVTLGAAALAGEQPDALTATGILLVSLGIISLARGWTRVASAHGIVMALATGCFIGAYTVTDGLGARLSGNPLAYSAWLFLFEGLPVPLICAAIRGRSVLRDGDLAQTLRAITGSVISLLAYAVVIWAATIGPLGTVSALRETSVVFAALIGRIFLGETLTASRLASCFAVALGAFFLGLHH